MAKGMRRSKVAWAVALVLLLLPAGWAAVAAAPVACSLLWGHSPTLVCLLHGELAKEGLTVDNFERSFSVGYEDMTGSGPQKGLLQIRGPNGGFIGKGLYPLNSNTTFFNGVWVQPAGTACWTIGTFFTGNWANPNNLVLTRWTPGSGTPWSSPVNATTVHFTPTMLGLSGNRTWGCRVIWASPTDLFISGCTDVELFVARVDKQTLSLVTSWGVSGVASFGSTTPNACPTHATPGAFLAFNFYPQAFIELVGNALWLGGTLINDLAGVPLDQDFVMSKWDATTGALASPFGVQYSRVVGNDYMKAMAATGQGVYATGTLNPGPGERMQLLAWHQDGSLRPPFYTHGTAPSRGNDVEAVVTGSTCHVFVGGYDQTNGATWSFTHAVGYGQPLTLPTLWRGVGSSPNPKAYGPATSLIDEVYDIGLGSGLWAGHVFSVGGVQFAPSQFGQPLQCIAPSGAVQFSNNPSPLTLADDRATAVVYHSASLGTVFTHGTAFDPGSFLNCIGHWSARSSRFKP
ncbi:MAG: hypothetical protein JNL90_00575 [Planctomycetes bacterium]|nr:hypothetical protein [Planctomycetota bacterium]